MSNIRTATPAQEIAIAEAINLLRLARERAKYANSPKTVQRIRLALTSAGGAQRHMGTRRHKMRLLLGFTKKNGEPGDPIYMSMP